ncbi:MAG: Fe-S cluster assembly ATPase SufC [Planctomycetota bacterium]|jgi:Fe-S cluster assembly ATP-binding protein
MLKIENLHVSVDGKAVLKGLDLEVGAGEVHAIMGPNGSGKSTLSYVIAGREGYDVTDGSITYQGQDLLALEPEARACAGVFLAFQYPVEIPGVSNMYFLRTALNAVRRARGEEELDAVDFLEFVKSKRAIVEMPEALSKRAVNQGFSGGEKKRNEIFQMAVLDETDSGLDVDALRIVAEGVNTLRADDRAQIVITHYERLLEYLNPGTVHILMDGRIVETGDMALARRVETQGYRDVAGATA